MAALFVGAEFSRVVDWFPITWRHEHSGTKEPRFDALGGTGAMTPYGRPQATSISMSKKSVNSVNFVNFDLGVATCSFSNRPVK